MRVDETTQSLTRVDPCSRALYPSMVLVVGISAVLWLLRGERHGREEISPGIELVVRYGGSVEKIYSNTHFP